jgi:hypothetical protein
VKKKLQDIYYSFPLRLILLHLRYDIILLSCWVLLILMFTGSIGKHFGIKFLFLGPEYLGKVNFWSYLILGLSFGWFMMTWHLTCYLIHAHRFPFLASLSRPFTKFCINNSVVSLVFVLLFLSFSIPFQLDYEYLTWQMTTLNCIGFLSGLGLFILLAASFFQFTNKDIASYSKGKHLTADEAKNIGPGISETAIDEIKKEEGKWRVTTYLTETLRPRIVRSVAHYEDGLLLGIFRQNHSNALKWLLMGLILLMASSYLIDMPYLRIPTGASIFILTGIAMALIGAVTYWLDRWRMPTLIFLIVLMDYLAGFNVFIIKNRAYGLDYNCAPVSYHYDDLEKICSPGNVLSDKEATLRILDNWHRKVATAADPKPKMVLFCTSGGGLRATAWTMQVVQKADSLTHGKLMQHTTLMTGASGGMFAAAYLRELYLQKSLGRPLDFYNPAYIDSISGDILNAIGFTVISNDLFLPWGTFHSGDHIYTKDRGYIFEKQLNENTGGLLSKRISDYRKYEQQAKIPMMFLSPAIVNDGRRMIISPQPVSYMMTAPIGVRRPRAVDIDAIDFGRLFTGHEADSLPLTTALRMNATYPYILPNVFLPTDPGIEVMDAGFRDNYGLMSASRFLHVFKDWIQTYTSGVVLVQVVGWENIEEVEPSRYRGTIESLLNPLGLAGQMFKLQEFESDTNLAYLYEILGKDRLTHVRFVYHPTRNNERASVTFHITAREKQDVLNAFYLPENQESMRQLREALR